MSAAYKAQLQMTELAVREIVNEKFETYEADVALPRQKSNTDKLDQLLSIADQIKGAVIAIKWILKYLGSVIIIGAAVVKIIETVRGH